jgi:hypothetical protein
MNPTRAPALALTQAQQGESLVLKLAMKCAHCCMWCLQKTVEFVSYYGRGIGVQGIVEVKCGAVKLVSYHGRGGV